jgi:hypothetical protein
MATLKKTTRLSQSNSLFEATTADERVATQFICWTRIHAESGQGLRDIVRRKEIERQSGDGVFFWGVGNAPSRMIRGAAKASIPIDVIFSKMTSVPKKVDSAPDSIVVWRRFIDFSGVDRPLPESALVTSKAQTASSRKSHHYALICHSSDRLQLDDLGSFDHNAYCNVGEVGGKVGASQVTALLRKYKSEVPNGKYKINLKAKLWGSYWVKLIDPIEVTQTRIHAIQQLVNEEDNVTSYKWKKLVRSVRGISCGTEQIGSLL